MRIGARRRQRDQEGASDAGKCRGDDRGPEARAQLGLALHADDLHCGDDDRNQDQCDPDEEGKDAVKLDEGGFSLS
jgi:hypothetical protein